MADYYRKGEGWDGVALAIDRTLEPVLGGSLHTTVTLVILHSAPLQLPRTLPPNTVVRGMCQWRIPENHCPPPFPLHFQLRGLVSLVLARQRCNHGTVWGYRVCTWLSHEV